MRAVVQRVSEAKVIVNENVIGSIATGLLVYLGVDTGDGEIDLEYVVDKVRYLRIFPDEAHRMNLDVVQAGGSAMVISAFTVQADARRGRRPSLESAAAPNIAEPLYERFCKRLNEEGVPVARGSFGAMMDVDAVNAGPVCILIDSRRTF